MRTVGNIILVGLFFLSVEKMHAQNIILDEHFSVNNKSHFLGDTANFEITTANQLQLNGYNHADTAQLWHTLSDSTWQEQQLWVSLKFSPSATNQFRWYLACNSNDESDSIFTGYYIEVGENGNNDTWHLKKRTANTFKTLISGKTGLLSKSTNTFRIRVRHCNYYWSISIDSLGSHQFEWGKSVLDTFNFKVQFCGIQAIYTSTRAKSFYFDDWYIGDSIQDYQAPYLVSLSYSFPFEIVAKFSECVKRESALNNNFLIDGISADSVFRDKTDFDKIHFYSHLKLEKGLYYIFASNIEDEAGNRMQGMNMPLNITKANYQDIVISEFMADPSPSKGLPNTEFIELYNRSNDSLNLLHFYVGDSSHFSKIETTYWLHRNEYLIICPNNTCSQFQRRNCIEIAPFPTLNNGGDQIILLNTDSSLIDLVAYDMSYYGDEFKSEGGYSIERLDLKHPCASKSNWSGSLATIGGTPGLANSQNTSMSPHEEFMAMHGQINNSHEISIVLNESIQVDQLTEIKGICSQLKDTLRNVKYNYKYPNNISFYTNEIIDTNSIYTIQLMGALNCYGQSISSSESLDIGYGFEADSGTIHINEILFNPKPGDNDYIELINSSSRCLDLYKLKIGKLSSGVVSTHYSLVDNNRNILPGEIICLSKDPEITCANYPHHNKKNIIPYSSICSMNDDTDRILLINTHGIKIDEIAYHENWQHPLLKDLEGVALERRNCSISGLLAENWASGAANDNYGSPGLENSASQANAYKDSSEDWIIYPKVITPNGDGLDDYLFLKKKSDKENLIAELKIINESGELIKNICGPQTISNQEWPIWNGLTEDCRVGPTAIYYVWIRYGILNGKTKNTLIPFFVNSSKNF